MSSISDLRSVEDVSGLANRLDTIDGTINSLARKMSTFQTDFSGSTKAPSRRESMASTPDLPWSDAEDLEMVFYHAENPNVPLDSGRRIAGRNLFDRSRRILEGFLAELRGSTPDSAASSGSNMPSITPSLLARASPTFESELRAKLGSYPLSDAYEEPLFKGPDQPVATPPRSLLDNALQYFLDEFNAVTPIFHPSRLRNMIDSCYTSGSKDESWDLCFNNVLVLTMGLRSRLARMSSSRVSVRSMREELLPAFLNNSFRAFSHLESFLEPRLVNVQALATLALVAREYHESKVFEMICHLASNVLKSIGLQHGDGLKNDASESDLERKELYWALFNMDKQRTFIAGRAFDLHFYETDDRLFDTDLPRNTQQQYRTAHIHMMAIWEKIYISLYSSRAMRADAEQRQHQISKLDQLSKKWCTRNGHLLPKSPLVENTSIDSWRVELKYCFHVGQVVIHRASEDDSSRVVEVSNARAALQIIQGVWTSKHTEATAALLVRLLRYYPLVALHGLYARFLIDPCQESLADLALIRSVAEALRVSSDPTVPRACLRRVYEGIAWYMEVAEIIYKAIKDLEASNKTQGHGPKRPQGSLHASPQMQSTWQAQDPPAKRQRNSPPRNKKNSPSISWMTQEVDTNIFKSLPSEFQPSQPLTTDPTTSIFPNINTAHPEPSAAGYSTSTSDDLSQFLLQTLPTLSPNVPQTSNQSGPESQSFSQQQQQQQHQQIPFPHLTAASSGPMALPTYHPNGGTGLNGIGGNTSAVNDVRDTSFFDPFFGQNDFPSSWEVELAADPPIADDFFLQG